MFIRVKTSGNHKYLQLVENHREGSRVNQTVIASLGRLDRLQKSGAIDRLVQSASRLADTLMLLSQSKSGQGPGPDSEVRIIGPALVFEQLWSQTGCRDAVLLHLSRNGHKADTERAIFSTVLRRIMMAGSGSGAFDWIPGRPLEGSDSVASQQVFQATTWLGQASQDPSGEAGSPLRMKDLIEETMFDHPRDLFTDPDLVIFVGHDGGNPDRSVEDGASRNADRRVLGLVISGDGEPVCSEMRSGSTADVTTIEKVADRLRHRSGVREVCLVADAGINLNSMIAALEARGWTYILGTFPWQTREIFDAVLADDGPFEIIAVTRHHSQMMEFQVKEVRIQHGSEGPAHRYIVCRNPAEMHAGSDGVRLLHTNTTLAPVDVALRYLQLWMVEQIFRTTRSALQTLPGSHQKDAAICGHFFCSYLALVLQRTLMRKLESVGISVEWDEVLRNLAVLTETRITQQGKTFAVRGRETEIAAKVAQCAGVVFPGHVRLIEAGEETQPAGAS